MIEQCFLAGEGCTCWLPRNGIEAFGGDANAAPSRSDESPFPQSGMCPNSLYLEGNKMVVSEWRDIVTAPKGEDAPMVLVHSACHPEDYHTSIAVAFWGTVDAWGEDPREAWLNWWEGMNEDDEWAVIENVTHWMPLPQAPEPPQ